MSAGAASPPVPFNSPDRRAVVLWRARLLLQTGAGALAVLIVEWLLQASVAAGSTLDTLLAERPTLALLPPLLAAVAGLVLSAFLPAARYRSWGYLLRAGDVVIRRGVLWRAVSVVPNERIQHVDTRSGPLERWFGLSSVVIFTAGTHGAVLTIPGLEAGVAERLRDRLAELGGTGDAV